MNIACVIMTLAVCGQDSPADAPKFEVRNVDAGGVAVARTPIEREQISFEVRILDVPAAEWREKYYGQCKRVGREGRSTVWTIDEGAAATMIEGVKSNPRTRIVAQPKMTAFAGQPCEISTKQLTYYVADVDRIANGPYNHAGMIAFQPSVDQVADGVRVGLSGRKNLDGVRAHVAIESSWMDSIMSVNTVETLRSKERGDTTISATMQLPQVVEAKLEGDYQIPAGGQMLVSLGTAQSTRKGGAPIIMERLALIAARPIITEVEETRLGLEVRKDEAVRAASAYMPKRMEMPPLPSRSPILGYGPDGKPAPIAVDPEVIPARATESATPRPSPQTTPSIPIDPSVARSKKPEPAPLGVAMVPATSPATVAAKVHRDPAVSAAKYEPMPIGRANATLDGPTLASGGVQTIRIPVGGKLSIELKARVVPAGND